MLTFVFLGQRMAQLNKDQQIDTIDSILNRVRDEVALAQVVENGYLRHFKVPSNIMGEEYSIIVDESGWVIITFQNSTYYKAMPQPMVGGFCLTETDYNYLNLTVSKDDDLVSLSSCADCSYSYAECKDAEDNSSCDVPGFNETCCSDHCKCC